VVSKLALFQYFKIAVFNIQFDLALPFMIIKSLNYKADAVNLELLSFFIS
jgi:hypothetical protein